jgi:CRP/FNR family cyclic AMP-dependent transcriptional regulator
VISPTADQLAQAPLFASMSAPARDALAAVFETQHFRSGQRIVRQGDSGYAFYVVAQGAVEAVADGEVVRRLGPGDHFGEIAIIGGGRRTATVTAVSDIVVWVLFGTNFRELEMSEPDVAEALRNAMLERLS